MMAVLSAGITGDSIGAYTTSTEHHYCNATKKTDYAFLHGHTPVRVYELHPGKFWLLFKKPKNIQFNEHKQNPFLNVIYSMI